jgi:hypothetical protein
LVDKARPIAQYLTIYLFYARILSYVMARTCLTIFWFKHGGVENLFIYLFGKAVIKFIAGGWSWLNLPG